MKKLIKKIVTVLIIGITAVPFIRNGLQNWQLRLIKWSFGDEIKNQNNKKTTSMIITKRNGQTWIKEIKS